MKLDDILITLNCFGSHWGYNEKTIQAKKIVDHFWKRVFGELWGAESFIQLTHYELLTLASNLEDILYVRRTCMQLMVEIKDILAKKETRGDITSLSFGVYILGWLLLLAGAEKYKGSKTW